jgi:hypothetical protein
LYVRGISRFAACDTYRMWDPRSTRVHVSRDIIWLGRMFFSPNVTLLPAFYTEPSQSITTVEPIEPAQLAVLPIDDDSSSNDDLTDNEETNQDNNLQENDGGSDMHHVVTQSGRVIQPPARFRENALLSIDLDADYALVGAGLGEGINHTQDLHVLTFQQAMKSPERDDQVLFLKRIIYGLKQAAQAFWVELLQAFNAMGSNEAMPIHVVTSKKSTSN